MDKKNPTASEMGKAGGQARAAKLSAKRRVEIARMGGKAKGSKKKTEEG